MNRCPHQLTLTDATGRSVTLEVEDEPFDQGQYDAALRRTEGGAAQALPGGTGGGSFTVLLGEVHVPKERRPGPHPYRWPAPRGWR